MSNQNGVRGYRRPIARQPSATATIEGPRTGARRVSNIAAPQNVDAKRGRAARYATPRAPSAEVSYPALLAKLPSCDYGALARECQTRLSVQEQKAREARYEIAGVAVGIVLAITKSRNDRARFNEAYESAFGREPKEAKLAREVFLLVHGEKRKDLAGTDAMALANAIRSKIAPLHIPAYIAENGGLEKLLEKERSRQDPMETVVISVCKSTLQRMEKLTINDHLAVKIFKCDAKASSGRFIIPRGS